MSELKEQIAYLNEDALFLPDEYDSCLKGHVFNKASGSLVAVYDAFSIIKTLVEKNEWSEEDAVEYYEYNIEGAYLGENTPLFLYTDP